VIREHPDVARALAQRRHFDGHDLQSIQEVLAQLPLVHGLLRIAIRRGDHADVDRNRFRRSDPRDAPALQDAQEAHLQVERHLGDLVEEKRAAVGALEVAPRAAARPP
jgi:hypothetical protein